MHFWWWHRLIKMDQIDLLYCEARHSHSYLFLHLIQWTLFTQPKPNSCICLQQIIHYIMTILQLKAALPMNQASILPLCLVHPTVKLDINKTLIILQISCQNKFSWTAEHQNPQTMTVLWDTEAKYHIQ